MTTPTYAGIGLDFGTTNSALAVVGPNQQVQLAQFPWMDQHLYTFRSVIYFSFEERAQDGRPFATAGPNAIERYLKEDSQGRLILSPKTSLASRLFDYTHVLGFKYTLEDLVSIIIKQLRLQAETQLGKLEGPIVVGRPVHFANQHSEEDEARAIRRLTGALAQSGFHDVSFEYEPVAAAYSYEANLTKNERILVADFGGGTTDFCIIQVGPDIRARGHQPSDILGTAGIPKAGDNLDGRIVHKLFAPHLGLGGTYKSEFKRSLPIPSWPYGKLAQWYTVWMLQEPKTMNMLLDLSHRADEPEKIDAFIDFIQSNLGFHLYHATEQSKITLSNDIQADFSFDELETPIRDTLTRDTFEHWISEELRQIADCCDQLFSTTDLEYEDIDRVFMTGGTSFVPAVREIFIDRFGADKLGSGQELTSVASGLALRARDKAKNQS